MEVLVGPTFSIDVSSPPAYVMDRAQDNHGPAAAAAAASCLFLDDGSVPAESVGLGFGLMSGPQKSPDISSESSSSIGEPGDSDEEGDEVSSKAADGDSEDKAQGRLGRGLGSLGSLASMEDSLPIKRGLSNHFSGKSKSFQNLSEVSTCSTVKDLEKQENPLNKRRRVLIACKWSRKSSFYGWHHNPKSMPLLTLAEDDDHDHDQQSSPPSSASDQDEERRPVLDRKKLHQGAVRKLQAKKSFKSASCFALSDLHPHQEEEDED